MLMLERLGRPKSIQFWLTCLVIVCILPAAAGAAFLLLRSYEQDRATLETARIGVARALMQAVDSDMAGATSVLKVLAESPLIASGDIAGFHAVATRVMELTSGNNIVLSLPDGTQVMNTLKPFGTPLPAYGDVEMQRRTLKPGGFMVSCVFFGPVAGHPLAVVRVPVIIDGRIKFTLARSFFPEHLEKILLRQNMPPGWVAALYDQHGIIAARTKAADKFVGKPGAAEAVRTVAHVPEGALVTYNLEGEAVHAAFSRSVFSGWAVVIAIPAAAATAELRHSLWLNGIGALTALLLAAALARRVGLRISKAITALQEPALALGSCDTVALAPCNIIEVDALRMVLLKAATLIKQRVRERDTAEDAKRRMVLSAEAAEHANRAKSEFLASMNHELRTPLHGILGYAEMMRLEGDLAPTQANHVELMLAAGQHLLGLINAVLDLSQVEANQLELHPATIEVQDLARACLDVVRPAAQNKGLALALVAVGPLRLVTDPTRLRQVLVNLLGNAVKFTQTGTVELRLQPAPDGACIRLEVADTGPGIPLTHRHKLFRSFERLDGQALKSVEGAGLGLALSARLVALMGGRLGHDENPGGGSIFWLELPIGDITAPPPDTAAACELPIDLATTRTLRVLVVDDVAMNRDIARSFLASAGHQVTCAETGSEAIAAAANRDFDVILMDVRMPGMDGLEATRHIRSIDGRRARVPIIALTAQAFTEQVAECRAAGMNSHLGKPFDRTSLLSAVARVVEASPDTADRRDPASPRTTAAKPQITPVIGAEFQVLDVSVFGQTASHLAPGAVGSHLRTISALGKDLMRLLREPEDALANSGEKLAEAAHTLAGSAGMFGFKRLSAIGRDFERAVQTGAPEVRGLANALAAALEETLQEIERQLPSATVKHLS